MHGLSGDRRLKRKDALYRSLAQAATAGKQYGGAGNIMRRCADRFSAASGPYVGFSAAAEFGGAGV
jgi:hypothetical protein